MPNRKDPLFSNFEGKETIEFQLGPALGEKAMAHDHDSEARPLQPIFNALSQAVTETKLVLIEPNGQALASQRIDEGSSNVDLVFGCVTNEYVSISW